MPSKIDETEDIWNSTAEKNDDLFGSGFAIDGRYRYLYYYTSYNRYDE